jgi:predicted small metal-binding protein
MKSLSCGDIVPGCKAVMQGKDENEVMQQAADHAKKDHGMATIPPDVMVKVKAAIKEKN